MQQATNKVLEVRNVPTDQNTNSVTQIDKKSKPHRKSSSDERSGKQLSKEVKKKDGLEVANLQNRVLSEWKENGFIQHLRCQIRSELISQIKNKSNPIDNSCNNALEPPSLQQRLLNSVIIDFLKKRNYHYTNSVFVSEIGGLNMASLSYTDTLQMLKLPSSQLQSSDILLQTIIDERVNPKQSENIAQPNTNTSIETLEARLKEYESTIDSLQTKIGILEKIPNPATEQSINNEQSLYLSEKLEHLYTKLMRSLNREESLQDDIDTKEIEITSLQRENAHLKQLLKVWRESKPISSIDAPIVATDELIGIETVSSSKTDVQLSSDDRLQQLRETTTVETFVDLPSPSQSSLIISNMSNKRVDVKETSENSDSVLSEYLSQGFMEKYQQRIENTFDKH